MRGIRAQCLKVHGLHETSDTPFIVGDDDQLKILLFPPGHHDVAQRLCQACAVLSIQIGRWLVKR